ncbi:glutathione S-transferase family protein [Thioclava sp. FR2]|uniref:glutathione S-transferase family protein n=1 Tax=Thioclava sp. FR2 TaxID=3445780 RepID=UPI003EBA9C08
MIRIHHVAQARSFRVIWFCEEAGLPYEVVQHSFFDKSLRSPEFLALSPAGRVPAVEIDGQVMFESGAILEYLAETRAPALARAPGQADRITYLEWLHFAETIAVSLAILTQHHIVLREAHMRSPTVMKLEAKRLEKSLIAAARARKGEGVCGQFSAADVALGYGALIGKKFLRFEEPALLDWVAAMEARPAYRAALAKDGEVQIYTEEFYEAPNV